MRETRPGRRARRSSSAAPDLRPRRLLHREASGAVPRHRAKPFGPTYVDTCLRRSDGAWGPSPHPHAWPASWHWANFSPRGVSCEAWGVFLSVAKGNSRAPGLFSPRQALCDGSVSAWVHWTSERPFGRLCTLSPNVSPSVSPKRKKEAGHAKNMRHDLRFLMVETMGLEPTTSGLQSPRFFSRA